MRGHIKQQLVSQDVMMKRSYGAGNQVTSITIHQTGNPRKGANAAMHARLQSRLNPRQASWHYQVDDTEVIQSFPDNVMCWAAGDGRGPGNTTSIHVEICINSDGDYEQAIKNAVALVKMKCQAYNLKTSDVKRHFDWVNKFCPEQLMRGHEGITWDDFLTQVKTDDAKPKPPVSKPAQTHLYRVRRSWAEAQSQKGAFTSLTNAHALARKYHGFKVFNTNGEQVTSPPKEILKITGRLDEPTIKALQRHFNTPVDGKLSNPSLLITAIQKWLGTPQDGYISTPYSSMVAALQRKLGMQVIDGQLSEPSSVITEMQHRMNQGTLFLSL